MAGLSPQEIAAQWKASMAASGDKIKKKVQAVTENPAEKAIAAIPYMRQRVLAAIDDGTVEAGLRKVTLTGWKAAMSGKGVSNMQAGLADGMPKVAAYQAMAAPTFDAIRQAASAIPKDGTTQSSLERVRVAIEGMKTLKGRMRGA